jgi:hypothetical protein
MTPLGTTVGMLAGPFEGFPANRLSYKGEEAQ